MAISQADAVLRLSNQVNGLTAAGIGLLLSVMLWVKYVRHESLLAELQASRARLIAQQAELEQLAVRDGLTGLWNRAALQRMALRELALAQRHGHETAFILIDLDRFKHINDGWGHPVGDRVLLAVAQALLQGARTTDEVARLGGEEFVILLPQTGLEAATILAERLRGQVAALLCPPVTLPITASFGVAATPGWPVTPLEASYERLYAAADAALYAAKHRGRNRVEAAPATPLP
jgi:diguanylate cyclase (GGDEF)-like protein